MLELGARHCYEFSVAEFMVHGAVVFGEFAKLLDSHEAGGNRHIVNSRAIAGFCPTNSRGRLSGRPIRGDVFLGQT